MPTFVREYGLIVALIAVALTGYFLMGDRREDILDYTLDMIGTRLVALAAGDEDREEIEQQFARFAERVQREELPPESIETVAANVLNLRARGAVITPEDAELMLFSEPSDALPSPVSDEQLKGFYTYSVSTDDKPAKPGKRDPKELNERLEVMFAFAEAVEMQADSSDVFIRFEHGEDGVHVLLDEGMAPTFAGSGLENVTATLQEKAWVKWEQNLAESRARLESDISRTEVDLQTIERAIEVSARQTEKEQLARWNRAQKLAKLGATTGLDTVRLNREIRSLVHQLTLELDSLGPHQFRIAVMADSGAVHVGNN